MERQKKTLFVSSVPYSTCALFRDGDAGSCKYTQLYIPVSAPQHFIDVHRQQVRIVELCIALSFFDLHWITFVEVCSVLNYRRQLFQWSSEQ